MQNAAEKLGTNEAEKKTPELQATELKAVFMESRARLNSSMEEWSHSDNPAIRQLADECRQALADAGLNPEPGKELPLKEIKKFTGRTTAIIAKFYKRLKQLGTNRSAAPENKNQ